MSVTKRVFNTRELLENDIPYESVDDWITETDRWSEFHTCVFQWGNQYYMATYSQGATEMQDESPWEDEPTITTTEVELVKTIKKDWRPVGEKRDPVITEEDMKDTIRKIIAEILTIKDEEGKAERLADFLSKRDLL